MGASFAAERFQTPDEVAAALEPFTQGADLTGLLAAALKAPELEANSLPPIISPRQFPQTPAPSLKEPLAAQGASSRKFVGLLMLLVLFVLAAGMIIRIATDNGELIVRAEEDAQVVVRRSGTTVRQLEVEKGDHTVTVRSGDYELELKSKGDELMVSRNAVSIKRGERVVVHIQQRPKSVSDMGAMMGMGSLGASPKRASSKPEPIYDGQTYSQWLALLRTERKPERLTEAILAFASLGEDDRELAARSAAAIMQVMRRNGSRVFDNTPQGKLIAKAYEVLLQMPGEAVVDAIEDELREGNTRSRTFVITWLLSGTLQRSNSVSSTNVELDAAVDRRSDSLCQLLLSLPDDEASQVRADALSLVVGHAASQSIAFEEIAGLAARLHAAVNEKDLQLVAVGTNALVTFDPDHEELLPALIRLVTSPNHSHRLNAVRSLGELGARSHVAVESLIKIIQPLAEENAVPPVKLQAGEMYGGEGYGAGMYGGMSVGGYGEGLGGFGGYHPSHDIYYVTIEALGKIGPAAKEALPLLRKIAARRPPTVELSPGGSSEYGFAPAGQWEAYGECAKAAIGKIEGD